MSDGPVSLGDGVSDLAIVPSDSVVLDIAKSGNSSVHVSNVSALGSGVGTSVAVPVSNVSSLGSLVGSNLTVEGVDNSLSVASVVQVNVHVVVVNNGVVQVVVPLVSLTNLSKSLLLVFLT